MKRNELYFTQDGDFNHLECELTYDQCLSIAEALDLKPEENCSGPELDPVEWTHRTDTYVAAIELRFMQGMWYHRSLHAIVCQKLNALGFNTPKK